MYINVSRNASSTLYTCPPSNLNFPPSGSLDIPQLIASLILMLASPVTVCFNLLAIIVICSNRCLRTFSNVLIVNLCITDLMTGLLTQPFYAADMLYAALHGRPMCILNSLAVFSGYLFGSVSYMVLFLIWVDRFCAIFHPFWYFEKTQSFSSLNKCIIALWLYTTVALLASWFTSHFVYFITQVMIALPLVYLWCVYVIIKINIKLRKIRTQDKSLNVDRTAGSNATGANSNATKLAYYVLTSMFLCYCPLTTSLVLNRWKLIGAAPLALLRTFSIVIVQCNSFITFFVYCFLLKQFRRKVFDLLQLRVILPMRRLVGSNNTSN